MTGFKESARTVGLLLDRGDGKVQLLDSPSLASRTAYPLVALDPDAKKGLRTALPLSCRAARRRMAALLAVTPPGLSSSGEHYAVFSVLDEGGQ